MASFGGVYQANAKISASQTINAAGSTTVTVYTAPANGFAIIDIVVGISSFAVSCNCVIGLNNYYIASGTGTSGLIRSVYVGNGAAVQLVATGGGTTTASINVTGVEFVNS